MKSKKILLALLAGCLVALLAALPAYAQLSGVSAQNPTSPNGGISARTGFPTWYQDDAAIRLKLCVDSGFCLGGDSRPNRNRPAGIKVDAAPNKPGLQPNLPDEAFYAVSRAETDLDDGGRIRWRAVLEGAFANEAPRAGDQIVFTRTQVTGSNINLDVYPAGTVLTFVTPYGNLDGAVTGDGTLEKARLESSLGTRRNDFSPPVTEIVTGYGPTFMKWDTGAPAGFLGNPLRPHTAIGGPAGNTFHVERGGAAVSPLVTRFEISGQCVQNTC